MVKFCFRCGNSLRFFTGKLKLQGVKGQSKTGPPTTDKDENGPTKANITPNCISIQPFHRLIHRSTDSVFHEVSYSLTNKDAILDSLQHRLPETDSITIEPCKIGALPEPEEIVLIAWKTGTLSGTLSGLDKGQRESPLDHYNTGALPRPEEVVLRLWKNGILSGPENIFIEPWKIVTSPRPENVTIRP